MKRIEFSAGGVAYSFDDISAAASRVNGRMLASIPDTPAPSSFSAEFERSMEFYRRMYRRRRKISVLLRGAASSTAVALLISLSALGVDVSAREKVLNWWKNIFDERTVYVFQGGSQQTADRIYGLGWIPEGFEPAEEDYGPDYGSAFYLNGEHVIAFSYSGASAYSAYDIFGGISPESVRIGDIAGEFYLDEEGGNSHLVWIDETLSFAFTLSSDLDKETIIRMAESLTKK